MTSQWLLALGLSWRRSGGSGLPPCLRCSFRIRLVVKVAASWQAPPRPQGTSHRAPQLRLRKGAHAVQPLRQLGAPCAPPPSTARRLRAPPPSTAPAPLAPVTPHPATTNRRACPPGPPSAPAACAAGRITQCFSLLAGYKDPLLRRPPARAGVSRLALPSPPGCCRPLCPVLFCSDPSCACGVTDSCPLEQSRRSLFLHCRCFNGNS